MVNKADRSNSTLTGKLKATGIHLVISLGVVVLAALLVFLVWYPYPYTEISGGRELFFIVVAVDVVIGPLMTLALYNNRKSREAISLDLSLIAMLQLAALGYGLWTVALARPVHLVFEIDRFRVVHAIDIPPEFLNRAPAARNRLPLTGPTLLSVRDFKDSKEGLDVTMDELRGVALGFRPDFWQPYEKAAPRVLARAKPLADLKVRFPAHEKEIDTALQSVGRASSSVGYVPMMGRQAFWTVLVELKTAEVIAFVPIDSF